MEPNQADPNRADPSLAQPNAGEPTSSEPFQPEPLAPMTGYEVPYLGQPGYDPLISADYGGWWQRGIAIVKAGWPQLAAAAHPPRIAAG